MLLGMGCGILDAILYSEAKKGRKEIVSIKPITAELYLLLRLLSPSLAGNRMGQDPTLICCNLLN